MNDSENTVLVLGGTGATGQELLKQLLKREGKVKAIVRSTEKLPESLKQNGNLHLIQASFLDLTDDEIAQHVQGCTAVASCLGHNLTFKGMYGQPRKLVLDASRRLCEAIHANQGNTSIKFVLMNTAGNSNRDLSEPISFAQTLVIGLLRALLPPHGDNEQAADYLRTQIDRKAGLIEWVVVRPDGLINEDKVSAYELHPSPTRSALFNPGKSSRINVAHFMAELICEDDPWQQWKWQMPVLYNSES